MKSRASRSKGDSRKTSRQESSKGSSATSLASTSTNAESKYSNYSGSLHRPGSMTNNVSHTFQRKINREDSSDKQTTMEALKKANAIIEQSEYNNSLEQKLRSMASEQEANLHNTTSTTNKHDKKRIGSPNETVKGDG